ncbi:MAG TPA: twin-arginine translocation signal domain-containing protein [Opitutaceae bacterium]|nr:twin-arginine translocation signal domain-containing protein [Opitutaceae bacterium]
MTGLDRRQFLQWAGAAAAAALAPRALGSAARPFEVSASLYAWELHDEGVERVLDHLQGMAAVNSVYLIGVMHPERRPLGGGVFPHNPVRSTWTAEDARCYWHPDLRRYGRIKPRLSDHAWLSGTDWLESLAQAARRRGLRLGMENSHALVDRERAEGELADCACRDLRGGIVRVRPWLRPLCPNHPDVRAYTLALFAEAAESYRVDYVQSAIVSFEQGGPERAGCFCPSCRKAAAERGLDLAAVQAALLRDPRAEPALSQWRAFRFDSTAGFYRELHAGLRRVRPDLDLRYSQHMARPEDWGVDLVRLRPQLDSLRIQEYTEQAGDPAAMPGKRARLAEIRRRLGPGFPIHSAIGTRLKATPALIREGIAIAAECRMNGVTLGHYDGATFAMLRAVREGLAASVPGFAPA